MDFSLRKLPAKRPGRTARGTETAELLQSLGKHNRNSGKLLQFTELVHSNRMSVLE
jgi:hypothetical protein